jgi:uncharacterized membrane protein YtjA (UPF0391 family)
MLGWALAFLVLALVASVFGFGVVASTAAGAARVLFFVFIAFFVAAFVTGLFTERTS